MLQPRSLLIKLSERVGGSAEDGEMTHYQCYQCHQWLAHNFVWLPKSSEFALQDVLDPEGFVKGIADLIRSGKSVGFRRMTHSDA